MPELESPLRKKSRVGQCVQSACHRLCLYREFRNIGATLVVDEFLASTWCEGMELHSSGQGIEEEQGKKEVEGIENRK